jgi:cyclase
MRLCAILTCVAGIAALGQSPGAAGAPLEVLHVRGNVYLFASTTGNVTVQIGKDPGHDGVLLVDAGPAPLADSILAEIRKLSREPIRYILQTSASADHTGGTGAIAKPDGRPFYEPAAVAVFAPTLTFDDGKVFEFNGETVEMFAEPAAHSDGDSVVFFRGSNVISTGDVFLTTGYPVIDLARGGSVQGEINALNHILKLSVPHQMQEGGTMVIPGRGRLCDQADVVEYRDMLTIIRDRIADLIGKGKSLDEVRAARPTRDYDRRFSTASWTGDMLTEAVYKSLQAGGSARK